MAALNETDVFVPGGVALQDWVLGAASFTEVPYSGVICLADLLRTLLVPRLLLSPLVANDTLILRAGRW